MHNMSKICMMQYANKYVQYAQYAQYTQYAQYAI